MPDGRGHPKLDFATRVDDGDHPLTARIAAWRMLELEEILDDALELAFHGPWLLAAQDRHLLGEVQEVDRAVPALISEATQPCRLIARVQV